MAVGVEEPTIFRIGVRRHSIAGFTDEPGWLERKIGE
jgi:hypothetical protein